MIHFSRRTLVQILIAKSVAEALLVTAVAAGFYLTTTNSQLRGWLDQADAHTISGWAVDGKSPATRVDVHQAERSDDDWHGFVFKTPPLTRGEHEARVYALYRGSSSARRTLQLLGKPLRFSVDAAPAQ